MARTAESVRAVVKAYDVRGVVGEQIDSDLTCEVGAAFARLVREEGATRVVIGHDMRDSSPELATAFGEGVTAQGLDVVEVGLTSTDELYFASCSLDCPGAMFTASHNPARYNGIKMCRSGARPVGQETGLQTITDELVEGVPAYDGPHGRKDTTYVLDFVNDPDEVLAAFQVYYETAELSGVTDPNLILDLKAKLDASGHYDEFEVDRVVHVELNPNATQAQLIAAQLYEGSNLDTFTQVEILAPYGDAIARDYDAWTAASAMLETAERLIEARESSRQQFFLLAGGLAALAGGEHAPGLVLDAFLLRSLAVAGWAPSFRDCARCGAPGPHKAFNVSAGGAVCPSCRTPGSSAPALATLALLGALLEGDWATAEASEAVHRREGRGLVAAFLQWHLERGVRSLRLVERA